MKFKKDNMLFNSIEEARTYICNEKRDCSLCGLGQTCDCFCEQYPRKAASLMGFEVIENEVEDFAETKKAIEIPSDIGCMTLAQVKEYCQNHVNGGFKCTEQSCEFLKRGICCSDFVKYRNLDLLTPQELEICRVLGAKWVSRDAQFPDTVDLWKSKPVVEEGDHYNSRFHPNGERATQWIACFNSNIFTSVNLGRCINVEELIGGESDG